MMSMNINISDIAILNIKSAEYNCIISKSEPINLSAKDWFDWKKQNIIKHKNFFSYIKMSIGILMLADIETTKNKF